MRLLSAFRVDVRSKAIVFASDQNGSLLSHFMARSLRSLEENLRVVRNTYKGDILTAEDLACYELP